MWYHIGVLTIPHKPQSNKENDKMTKVTKLARFGARKLAAFLVVAAGVGGALNVHGQTATLDTVGNVETLYTAANWSNGISPTDNAAAGWDYVAAKSGMRMPENQTLTFKCQSMTFGTSGTRCDFYAKGSTLTFENDGLHLFNTLSATWTPGTLTINGKVSFDNEPSKISFQGVSATSGNGKGTWQFGGPLYADVGNGFTFYSGTVTDSLNKMQLVGDLTGFNGTIIHTAKGGTLALSSSPLPGTVQVGELAILKPYVDDAGFSVGTLELAANSILPIVANRQTGKATTNRVTAALSVAGPVTVQFSETDSISTNDVPERFYPVLILSKTASGTLSKDDFVLRLPDGLTTNFCELVERNDDDGNPGVFVRRCARVKWVNSDQAMDVGANWSDGNPPSPMIEYVCPLYFNGTKWTGMNIRTPATSGHYTFTGRRLTLHASNLILQSYTSEFPDLAMSGGIIYMWHEYGEKTAHPEISGGTRWLKGNIRLLQGETIFNLSVHSYIVLDAAFSGSEQLTLNATSANGSWFELNAANTNFTGNLVLKGNSSEDESKLSHVVFSDARNFGDSPASFNYYGVNMQASRVMLQPARTMTFDTQNRGFLFYDGGFDVPTGMVLTLKSVVSYNGTFRKLGGGTLAFAAPLTRFAHNAATAAAAAYNTVLVRDGWVTGGNTNATAGLAFTFSGNAGIAASLAEEDAATRQFGLYDVAWATPVTVSTDDSKIHVKVLPDAQGEYPTSFSVPFLTVAASAAEALTGKFVVDQPAPKMYGNVSVRTNGDGTKTFIANAAITGMTIIFR